ncbi:flavin reductase [Porphyromonas crevioricanis]|uniref:Flavin reductase n=2 Tax=Porphyromonas crevioricanis TaxID=393921 RepID=A0A0A2FE89_9PORP|nr:flavin reductase family protein [Porphyromonas crevioricanis]KGN89346.1 flavin reductase [Porphyromonas crevioricanis]KGN93527.1 flavin reductase [Porphyromonas crevioricanis]SJZ87991.1 NADH-FMN oxidoreductase RutF, flavin reductase (DIM6/NTAB) family [Porphyromonas crevioricanis]SQH73133.1 Flavoredoxin [Porphyromonas crevioricanis]GAD05998.1 flavoredoxin [Porphyromonas crevioricanis JCM 15906]
MSRQDWKPGTLLYPLPAALVSCGDSPENYNLITVSWTGTICSTPPMCYISVRKERHSHAILSATGEFGLNLTNRAMAKATDWCGVRSGKDYDKFAETGLQPEKGKLISAPLVAESPLSLECKIRQVLELGSHDMFLADVVNVRVDPRYLDPESGAFDMQAADLLVYAHGEYFALGDFIGYFGWSVKKTPGAPQRRYGRKG